MLHLQKQENVLRSALIKTTILAVLLLLIISFQSCITLTAKKQTLSFTSTPSGATVYGVYERNSVSDAGHYCIGVTPCTYTKKGGLADAFIFVKDGYRSQSVVAEKKGRWVQYYLGNWLNGSGVIGWLIDAKKIYKYKQTNYNVTLAEVSSPTSIQNPTDIQGPTEIPSQSISQPASIRPILSMPKIYEPINARSVINPAYINQSSRKIMSAKDVYRDYANAVFMVFGGNGASIAQGSGFVINKVGVAVSNYHNFDGMNTLGVKMYGQDKLYYIDNKDIIAFNESEDYIIFKLPSSILSATMQSSFTFIPVANKIPEVGEKVYTIGSPKALENTLSSGEVSALREPPYSIQINAPIDHGSSGGALINEYGEAIGITSAGRDDSGANLNFAIDLVRILNKYK